jgi:hypothetical protein
VIIVNVPKFNVEAMPYDKALASAKTFSKLEVNNYLWLHIPVEYAEDFKLTGIYRVMPTEIDLTDSSYRDNYATWIKVPTADLKDYNVLQVFKVTFENILTSDEADLFFAYSVQTEDVEKPYIYVKQDDETEN